jgi:hypothetical protein
MREIALALQPGVAHRSQGFEFLKAYLALDVCSYRLALNEQQ